MRVSNFKETCQFLIPDMYTGTVEAPNVLTDSASANASGAIPFTVLGQNAALGVLPNSQQATLASETSNMAWPVIIGIVVILAVIVYGK